MNKRTFYYRIAELQKTGVISCALTPQEAFQMYEREAQHYTMQARWEVVTLKKELLADINDVYKLFCDICRWYQRYKNTDKGLAIAIEDNEITFYNETTKKSCYR